MPINSVAGPATRVNGSGPSADADVSEYAGSDCVNAGPTPVSVVSTGTIRRGSSNEFSSIGRADCIVITRAVEDTPQLWASATPIDAGSGRDVDVIVAFRLFARQKTAVGIAVGGLAVAVGLCTALFTGSASRARVVRQMLTESLVRERSGPRAA
jgi:predicted nicotinamide N-methyase